jgi:hypothetical protein
MSVSSELPMSDARFLASAMVTASYRTARDGQATIWTGPPGGFKGASKNGIRDLARVE